MHTVDSESIDKLRHYDTPTICNVIELFNIRPRNKGYMNAEIKANFPEMPPMVGFAATATFCSSVPQCGGDEAVSLEKQIERFAEILSPPVVVFQDLDSPSVAATFGEMMCTSYQVFGAAGLITSGAGRDLDQVRKIGFPTFTNGTICSHAYCLTPQVHIPVLVGGLMIYPNDLLHGDCNGVTTIPIEIASEVADVCDEFMAAEIIVLNLLAAGKPTAEVFRDAWKETRSRIAQLRERVSKK